MTEQSLPVVVIGAGPVGLAAAVHLLDRGFEPLILEKGQHVGAAMRQWGHVRLFSPWKYNVDAPARRRLEAQGWSMPDPDQYPTGNEVVDHYLVPLAKSPDVASHLRLNARVLAVTRQHRDRMKHAQRHEAPFVVRYLENNTERDVLARAVIDASGTTGSPNPLGASGIAALGERSQWENIFYGLPDVLGTLRSRYQGKRVLVVGSGHSAFNVLTDLASLNEVHPDGSIHWAVRSSSLQRVFGGGENDQLKERGRLGLRIASLADAGALHVHTAISLDRIERRMEGLVAWSGDRALPPVDEIVGATGFRPDLAMLSEVRLDIDPATESPAALAPLIDPNLHSCGTVRPHGADELKHPDPDLYVVGMKSYGRAPTFLMLTGYEQVRSVVAAIAGDWAAARRVELVLPETGVCNTQFAADEEASAGGCCGGPAPAQSGACCVADAHAKTAGKSGCGCGTSPRPSVASA